ncbi:IS5/IS1182 family transposase, partial [Aeromonas caviae]|nr:IS5/IS1182 family transposase [Aeromonas caviae]
MSYQHTNPDTEFTSKRRQTRKEIIFSGIEQHLPRQNKVQDNEQY